MLKRNILWMFAAAFLCACAPKQDISPALNAASLMHPTVSGYEEVRFSPLSFPESRQADVTHHDPVLEFASGQPSFFKAFELPSREAKYSVRVSTSEFVWNCYPCTSGIFVAQILLLDANKTPLSNTTVHGPVTERAWETAWRHVWVDIEPESAARYLIVHTSQSAMEEGHTVRIGGGVTSAGTLFIPVPSSAITVKGTPAGPMLVATVAEGDPSKSGR